MATNWETCPVCYGGDVNCPDNCDIKSPNAVSDLVDLHRISEKLNVPLDSKGAAV